MAKKKEHPNQRRTQARVREARKEALQEAGELEQGAKESPVLKGLLRFFTSNGVVLGTPERIARLVGRTPEAVRTVLDELEKKGVVEKVTPDLYMSV